MRKRDICAYCAKEFQPPDGPYNTGEPGSYEGWMVAYCCWDCAMLGDPENMKANGWDGEPLS